MALRPALVALTSGIAVIASGLTVPLTAGPAAAAERTATVVGSLQTELGCPGDWQPDCADTELTRDGDSTAYRAVFDVPAGTYEFKVAINGSWDENYGAGRRQERREHPAACWRDRRSSSSPTTTRPTGSASRRWTCPARRPRPTRRSPATRCARR